MKLIVIYIVIKVHCLNSKLVAYYIMGIVIIVVLFTYNIKFNPDTNMENLKLKNQTNVEENISKNINTQVLKDITLQNLTRSENPPVTFVGHVQHIISECAPSREPSQKCIFFQLDVLHTPDGKTYQLTNVTFPYKQLENKQVEIIGILVIPSTSKFVSVSGDLNVIKYSVVGNYTEK